MYSAQDRAPSAMNGRHLEGLYALASSLAAAVSERDVASAILAHGPRWLGAHAAAVHVGESDHLRLLVSFGFEPPALEQLRRMELSTRLPAGAAFVDRAAIFMRERTEYELRFGAPPKEYATERSGASVPLMVEDRAVGVLTLTFSKPHPFDEDEQRFILAAAAQCAQALERARLHEAEQRRSAALERQWQMSAELLERLRMASEASSDAIWEWSLVDDSWTWSEAAAGMFGVPRGALGRDRAWREGRLHPDDRKRVLSGLDAALARREQRWQDAYRMLRPDGSELQVVDRALVAYDGNGRPVRVVGTLRDVTMERRAFQTLELLAQVSGALSVSLETRQICEAVARLVVLQLADACAIHLKDSAGLPVLVASRHTRPELSSAIAQLGQVLAQLPPSAPYWAMLTTGRSELDRRVTDDTLERTPLPPRIIDLSHEVRTRSRIRVALRTRGEVIGVISLALCDARRRFDMRDLMLAEELGRRVSATLENAQLFEAVRQERDRVEQANRAKDEFLSVVSHELRTPLTAIRGWSGMLRARELPADKREKAVDTIDRNARTLTALVDDLIDLSRGFTGKLRLDAGPVDLTALVVAAVESCRPAAEAKGIALQLSVDVRDATLNADANRLQQATWHLVSNAIKFTASGGRVAVSLVESGPGAGAGGPGFELSVQDDGEGIAPELLPRLFERFRQGDTSITRVHGGLGVGLSIVRTLVELHGGSVHAYSDGKGRGARFVIRLPSSAVETAPVVTGPPTPSTEPTAEVSSGPASSDAPPATGQRLDGISVLLVEDAEDTRDVVAAMLRTAGAQVTSAAGAEEALQYVSQSRPQVVLTDLAMPRMDGYALLRALRAQAGPHVPTVAISAYALPEDRTRALTVGFDAHLAKPIDFEQLVATVRRAALPS